MSMNAWTYVMEFFRHAVVCITYSYFLPKPILL